MMIRKEILVTLTFVLCRILPGFAFDKCMPCSVGATSKRFVKCGTLPVTKQTLSDLFLELDNGLQNIRKETNRSFHPQGNPDISDICDTDLAQFFSFPNKPKYAKKLFKKSEFIFHTYKNMIHIYDLLGAMKDISEGIGETSLTALIYETENTTEAMMCKLKNAGTNNNCNKRGNVRKRFNRKFTRSCKTQTKLCPTNDLNETQRINLHRSMLDHAAVALSNTQSFWENMVAWKGKGRKKFGLRRRKKRSGGKRRRNGKTKRGSKRRRNSRRKNQRQRQIKKGI